MKMMFGVCGVVSGGCGGFVWGFGWRGEMLTKRCFCRKGYKNEVAGTVLSASFGRREELVYGKLSQKEMFIFFACLYAPCGCKENEPKEKTPLCHLSACGGFPVFLKAAGIKKTRPPAVDSNSFCSFFGIFSGTRRRVNGENLLTATEENLTVV